MERRVLIVEDEATGLEAMKGFFRSQGFAVDGASTSEEAMGRLAVGTYSFVITDLRLGTAGAEAGFEVVSAARATDASLPIIVMTAHPSAENESHARQRGADAVIEKPRSLWDVTRLARELMAQRG